MVKAALSLCGQVCILSKHLADSVNCGCRYHTLYKIALICKVKVKVKGHLNQQAYLFVVGIQTVAGCRLLNFPIY